MFSTTCHISHYVTSTSVSFEQSGTAAAEAVCVI